MSALVIYCHITNFEQLKSLQYNKHLLSHAVSMSQESGTGLTDVSNSERPMSFQPRCWLGLQSLEGFTGVGGSIYKMGHSHGCCQEPSVHYYMGLSIGPLECPHDMAPGFTRVGGPRESKLKATVSLII